jgi:hypothetical protein
MVAAAGLLVISIAIRLYRLDHFSYGLDEVLQTFFIQGNWTSFWKALKFDAIHPPLDYLITRFVEHLGPADWARKLPAVLWGLGTIASVGALLARRAGWVAGWIGALLLAFAPFHVRYSQRREVLNLEGEIVRLTWSWRPGERSWLVLAGEPRHPELRRWAAIFPSFPFPKAEGADLRRLDPALRERALEPGR